jgi:sugar phosphate isomerase/epimerase
MGGCQMKLGFLTACLPKLSLEQIADWAVENGYEALEVAAWPDLGERPFIATHLNVENSGAEYFKGIKNIFDSRELKLSSIAFYDNNLHPDQKTREGINTHVIKCIDAAAELGVESVGTFIGRDWNKPVRENLAIAADVFSPLVSYADSKNVKIIIENCVMEGWHPDGYPGNLAYSPELWEWMFGLGLYLNFDPSHLMWMGIDPIAAIKPYMDRIPHAQAKDIQIDVARRNHYGFPGKAVERENPWDVGWWRYRVPGLGDVDWRRLIDTMYEGGFDGTLSVEHEDPVWGGSPEKVQVGLKVAFETLRPLIVS